MSGQGNSQQAGSIVRRVCFSDQRTTGRKHRHPSIEVFERWSPPGGTHRYRSVRERGGVSVSNGLPAVQENTPGLDPEVIHVELTTSHQDRAQNRDIVTFKPTGIVHIARDTSTKRKRKRREKPGRQRNQIKKELQRKQRPVTTSSTSPLRDS